MIAQLRADAAKKAEERATHADKITEIRSACATEKRDPNADEATAFTAAVAARDALDIEIKALEARADEIEADEASNEAARKLVTDQQERKHEPAKVGREERTYTAEKSARGEASFFADSFRAMQMGDMDAMQRLQRHQAEVRAEGEFEERATTTSSYGSLVVPQYLLDQAAPLARAGRPVANIVQRLALPEQGMSVVIPRGTTGASEAVQATQNSAVSSTDQVWQDLTVPIVTIAGQQDVSRQSLERGYPGLDELVYLDLAGAYAVQLDAQVLSGSGSSGQMLGILNTAGINQATAFGAAATPATYYSKVAGQVNAVETTRFMAPNAIVMHPRRWNWLVSQLDSARDVRSWCPTATVR
jgi:HK97 family phage major capsid protein